MANVRLDGLYKRYEDVVAVDDMNLEIEDGEFICLVGPSISRFMSSTATTSSYRLYSPSRLTFAIILSELLR